MAEKRFFQDGNEILTWIRDKETWEKLKTDTDVINKLNELAEENEQSKMMIATLRNTVLDQEDLEKENKEIKEELRIYRQVANCRNCTYHNYDWYDDGDEFEVCEKGNDVSEGICKDWEEL